MKQTILYSLLILVLTACHTLKHAYEDVFPLETPENVEFDMTLKDFLALEMDSIYLMETTASGTMYYGSIQGELLDGAIYYFGPKGEEPLYEIIFMYISESDRDADAQRLLGDKNTEQGWSLEHEPYNVKAWTYESKLIIAARIPDTEWYEEED
ncbi:MAG: hypothetical protein QNK23_02730 [Crocinitomicaceae bacterium]|nr:hypothetical protein [Crocinitomicaceae bacterium]